MKVVQLVPELNEGGVERGVVELNRNFVAAGLQSVVISNGGKLVASLLRDGGEHVKFNVCGKNLLTAPWRIVQLQKLLRKLAPDILHARSRVPAWLALLANRSLQIPFVTTVHGFNSVNPYSRVMTSGDRVICVSRAIREYVREHYAVTEDKLVVIPRGVDLQLFDPERLDQPFMTRFTREHELDGRFVVTSVGRITQLKDYQTLIRAVALVRRQIPNIKCLLVGGVRADKQKYFAELQALVAQLGLAESIEFTGGQQQVAEIYALSQIVVSSSIKPESFGRSAAEALAMNRPVVASAHGGMLDIVIPGQTGFLFTPGDADELAAALLRCRDSRLTGLREFVEENFTLERMTRQTLQVYHELTGRK